jgi:hypothetical protein
MEQYHNNFGCYTFVYRSDARHHVPTFRKKWLGSWMKKWFYVKNYLSQRSDIKDVIQWPIRSSFGLRRLAIVNTEKSQGCLTVFVDVCNYISTRDLV